VSDKITPLDPYAALRAATPARIGLGRSGDSLPTRALLDFQLAHARARDAVHGAFDAEALARELAPLPTICVQSQVEDSATYLRRPDLGRRLNADSRQKLTELAATPDVVFVIADGLSASAVQTQAATVISASLLGLAGLKIAPVVIARFGRVALGDEIAQILGGKLCVLVVGERPGLSVADSLGVYLTYAPRPGRRDSERNCISNIHANGGLSIEQAATTLCWLARAALSRKETGVSLKDESPTRLPFAAPPPGVEISAASHQRAEPNGRK
jgi:ethanolamine ammonia-lyase small subunit